MKTSQEIDRLKAEWKADPCWDIEDSDGFEDYRAELIEFRLSCEAEWVQIRRANHAADLKRAGWRAYSDSFNHVIVNCGGTEHGYDIPCAIQLRDALDRAISKAAIPDDQYS